MHVIIVACPHPPSCCIYTTFVPLLLGIVIPTSFNIFIFLISCFARFSLYRKSYAILCVHKGCTVQEFFNVICKGFMGVLEESLHKESTDSTP